MTPSRVGLVLGPLVFTAMLLAPVPEGVTREGARVLAVTALVAIFWITEAIPIPVASLLPLLLFPALRVEAARKTAGHYANDSLVLLAGGFVVALAVERSGLHHRLAFAALSVFGTRPRRLVLGFMCATAGLSLWTSNTATTLLMLPIALAIVAEVAALAPAAGAGAEITAPAPGSGRASMANLAPALLLGIAYAASIGGMGTIVGTPPNVICMGAIRALQPPLRAPTFAAWMAVGVPIVALFIPLAWLVLVRVAAPLPVDAPAGARSARTLIARQRAALGPWRPVERRVAVVFFLTALAWIFRVEMELGPTLTIPGWATALKVEKLVEDSTIAVAAALVLFVIPRGGGDEAARAPILGWEAIEKGIPWGMLLLFGGGLAIANGFESTGLSKWLAGRLGGLAGSPATVVMGATCVIAVFASEIASNTALATLLMPILAVTAGGVGIAPVPLMVAGALAASCGFMLPVATAPNAIVYGTGQVPVRMMVKAGLLLDLIGIVLITAAGVALAMPILSR